MIQIKMPVAFCWLIVVLLLASSAQGQAPRPFSGPIGLDKAEIAKTSKDPWNIEADKLSYDQSRQLYEAEGSVRLTSLDRVITADYASADMEKRRV